MRVVVYTHQHDKEADFCLAHFAYPLSTALRTNGYTLRGRPCSIFDYPIVLLVSWHCEV
jgi:hypothetical protein